MPRDGRSSVTSRSARQSRYRSPKRRAESCDSSRLRRASRLTSGIAKNMSTCPSARIERSSSTRTANPHTGFERCGSSCPSWRTRRQHYWRPTSCVAISRVGLGMYSAITRWPASCERSKSEVEPDRARRRYRKWPAPCVADTTWLTTKSRRRSLEISATRPENRADPSPAAFVPRGARRLETGREPARPAGV